VSSARKTRCIPELTRMKWAVSEYGIRYGVNRRICCSRMQRFQKMLCIQTRCHKLRSFVDHHRKNLFTALVNYRDLVEVDNAVFADGRLRAALQLKTNSPIHSFVNRPWRIHLCSEVLSFTVILNIRYLLSVLSMISLRQKDPGAQSCM